MNPSRDRRILGAAAALLAAWPAARASAAPSASERVDAYVEGARARQGIPGLAVAIVKGGKVALAKGYGQANLEHRVPVTTETLFQSGSVGKMFTAAAVMALVEDGKLSLDDPITRFHPDAPWSWRGITVRHLLGHTSGVPDYEDTSLDLRKDYTEDDLARFAFGLKLESAPGARWSYSNTGYVLLGTIVRKAGGRFYGEVLRERIFGPLGMKTARINSEEDVIPNRAAGYRLVDGVARNQEWVSPSINATADGSLLLSIRDLLAWEDGVRRRAALRPESWAVIFQPVRLASGASYPYGFGWFLDDFAGQPRQHHGGAWQGFKAYVARYLRDDVTVFVLVNLAEADPGALAAGIAEAFDPRLAPPATPPPSPPPAISERLRRLVEEARAGTLSSEELEHVRAGYFPGAAKALQERLVAAGSLQRLEPLWIRTLGDDQAFAFRAAFERGRLDLQLTVAPDGKIAAFWASPSPPGP